MSDVIEIKINNANRNRYLKLGYEISEKQKRALISIKDLAEHSKIIVDVRCDICGKLKKLRYDHYIHNVKNYNIYTCSKKCAHVSNKNKLTCLKKYGDENYNNRDKFKKTCLDKYGVDHNFKISNVKNKINDTMLERYGTIYPLQNEILKSKSIETCLKNNGVSCIFKKKEIRDKLKKNIEREMILKYPNINFIEIKSSTYKIYCEKCEKEYDINNSIFHNRIKMNTVLCTICNPIGSSSISGYEIQIQDFIRDNYNCETFSNNKILDGKELDIYLPDLKLAFEFNGLYWHNELNRPNNYHFEKTELAENQGIKLVHIYEDDWIYKQEIVKFRILNLLNKTPNKIYARKCEIKEVSDNKLIREFLDNNHLQGFVGSKIKMGLFYSGELVSLMTFGSLRRAMGQKSEPGSYEMLRFCNKLNTSIVGGASRLFKFFVKNFKPKEVTSYADRSWSQGELYKNLGFEQIKKTEPNYYYIVDGVRRHRFGFRKDQLVKEGFDPLKTEHEIMFERKIYRIYDSGNLKFIWNKLY